MFVKNILSVKHILLECPITTELFRKNGYDFNARYNGINIFYDTDIIKPIIKLIVYDTDIIKPIIKLIVYDADIIKPIIKLIVYDADIIKPIIKLIVYDTDIIKAYY